MAPDTPRISVCIPTFNRGHFLPAALESVFGQTRRDWEIVVCDDGSSDDSASVVQSFRGEARLRYIRHERNLGVSAARNSCLRAARGDYIAWLDSDDVYLPEMLEVQAGVLDQRPEVGLVHGAFDVIDSAGNRLPAWRWPFEEDTVEPGVQAFAELSLENYIAAPTVVVRRACHERAGPYPEGRRTASSTDWEMWLRVALTGDVAYSARVVANYRQHASSISAQTAESGERLRCDSAAIRRVFSGCARVPGESGLKRRAEAALAARAVLAATAASNRGEVRRALTALGVAAQSRRRFLRERSFFRLVASVARRDEFGTYRHARALIRDCYEEVRPSRFAARLEKHAVPDPAWEQMVRETAATIARVTPPAARVAVVDKHDPTILALSNRAGWHFPDQTLMPDGYPPDSDRAVTHVEQLRHRGATHLVFPYASFWWLEFYAGLRRYLDSECRAVCRSDACVVYDLRRARSPA